MPRAHSLPSCESHAHCTHGRTGTRRSHSHSRGRANSSPVRRVSWQIVSIEHSEIEMGKCLFGGGSPVAKRTLASQKPTISRPCRDWHRWHRVASVLCSWTWLSTYAYIKLDTIIIRRKRAYSWFFTLSPEVHNIILILLAVAHTCSNLGVCAVCWVLGELAILQRFCRNVVCAVRRARCVLRHRG